MATGSPTPAAGTQRADDDDDPATGADEFDDLARLGSGQSPAQKPQRLLAVLACAGGIRVAAMPPDIWGEEFPDRIKVSGDGPKPRLANSTLLSMSGMVSLVEDRIPDGCSVSSSM